MDADREADLRESLTNAEVLGQMHGAADDVQEVFDLVDELRKEIVRLEGEVDRNYRLAQHEKDLRCRHNEAEDRAKAALADLRADREALLTVIGRVAEQLHTTAEALCEDPSLAALALPDAPTPPSERDRALVMAGALHGEPSEEDPKYGNTDALIAIVDRTHPRAEVPTIEAARAEERERCAGECETWAGAEGNAGRVYSQGAARCCAARIRTLGPAARAEVPATLRSWAHRLVRDAWADDDVDLSDVEDLIARVGPPPTETLARETAVRVAMAVRNAREIDDRGMFGRPATGPAGLALDHDRYVIGLVDRILGEPTAKAGAR